MLDPPVINKPIAHLVKHQPVVVRSRITHTFTVKPNDAFVIDSPVATTDFLPLSPATAITIPVKLVDTSVTRNVNSVEFVPVFPGCESLGTNDEKKACMSSKIGTFISKRFNSDDFRNLKADETHKIWVQFKIDTHGNVTDVIARAPQKDMKDEGVRVLSKLPKMTPGKMGTTPVNVSYMIPISFRVQ